MYSGNKILFRTFANRGRIDVKVVKTEKNEILRVEFVDSVGWRKKLTKCERELCKVYV